MPSAKYTAQLITMVTPEARARYRSEAATRDVSLSQVVRERLNLADDVLADRTAYPDADTERDAREQQADRERFHQELGEPVQTPVEKVRQPRVTDAELDERFRQARIGRAPRDSTRP